MSESRKVAVDRKQDVARSPDSTGPANPSTGPDTDRTGAYVPEADPGLELPTVPGYELLGILGQGGMGVVYHASQRALKRIVALKMIRAVDAPTADALARFQAEAEAAARVQHANIVQIHEVGNRDGLPYFSLEFCAGGNLESRLNGGRLSQGEAAALLETLARAVQHAHDHGVVHRDLKPANVLLAGEPDAPLPMSVPKIADFGLAKTLDADSGQTRSGAVVGTPNYMAPEQAEGNNRAVGPAADIWALGAILYKCLTGRPPFQGGTVPQTLLLVRDADPVPPRAIRREIPRDLETICLKCLEKDPKRRYDSAGELADDLRRFREYQPILARPVGLVGKASRWVRRRPSVVLGALLLLATIAGGAVGYHYWDRAQENARKKDESDRKARESDRLAAEAQAVSVEYFTDIVNRRGLPEGIDPIPEQEARVTEGAFRVHKRGGRIERLEILNDLRGSRLDNSHAMLFGLRDSSPRVVATRYVFDEQGRPLREEGLDAWEYVHWVHAYLPGDEARLEVRISGANVPTLRMRNEWSPDGFPRVVQVIDEQGRPAAGPSGVAAIRIETDASGRFTAIETQDKDGRPRPAPVYAPTTTTRLVRDDLGRVIECTTWGADGKPVSVNGVHRVAYDHAPGRVDERRYDESGAPTNKIFQPHRFSRTYQPGEATEAAFRADGSPGILPGYQAHSITKRYTDRGVEKESVIRDPQGMPVNVNGLARQTFTLNENGMPVEQQRWMAASDGSFLLISRLNGLGRALEERAYTPDGKPSVKPPHGVFRVVYGYDVRGNNTEASGFDSEDRPTPLATTGSPRSRKSFDESNREIELLCLDSEGRPTAGSQGWARGTRVYDDTGKLKEMAYWVVDSQGKFRLDRRSNPQRFLLERAHHDPLGRPILGPQGYHRVKHQCDSESRPTDTRYFGVDDEPCDGPNDTPHRAVRRFTPWGQVAEVAFFGTDGSPSFDSNTGAHRWVSEFNHLGQTTETRFYGADGKPTGGKVRQTTGSKTEILTVARREHEYGFLGGFVETRLYKWTPEGEYRLWRRLDSAGRTLEEASLDDRGERYIDVTRGAHRLTAKYDNRGGLLESATFGLRGEPVVDKRVGVHRLRFKLDERGNQLEIAGFDADDKPADILNLNIHRVTSRYDANNRKVEQLVFGTDGKPAVGKAGYHRRIWEYDDKGKLLRETSFDADGKPVGK